MEPEDAGVVSTVLSGMANRTRVLTLYGVRDEQPLAAIAESADVTRSAIRQHVTALIDRELVYLDPDADYRFQVSVVGELVLTMVDAYVEQLVELLALVETAEQEAREELEPTLSGETLERAVMQRKWELVADRAEVPDTNKNA